MARYLQARAGVGPTEVTSKLRSTTGSYQYLALIFIGALHNGGVVVGYNEYSLATEIKSGIREFLAFLSLLSLVS